LNENEIRKTSGLTSIVKYRKAGLIKQVGYAITNAGLSAFYKSSQIKELKKKLGITLESTKGLLSQKEFKKASGLSQINRYRKTGLIKPVGYALIGPGLGAFYKPSQIKELKKKLGITLENIKGLLNEAKFIEASGLSRIADYRRHGDIKPAGYAIAGPGLNAFYRRSQIKELKKKLGVTLANTKGLLNENEFAKASGLTQITRYRKAGLIKPIGYAFSCTNLSPFYRRSQIKGLKKKLGITLESTKGLLNEKEFREASGLAGIRLYRKSGLIKPVGFAMVGSGLGAFYKSSQIKELKKKLGITLESTKGLLSEPEFKKASGLTNILRYRERGFIKPVGYAFASKLSAFYRPSQIKELKKKLGKL